MELLFSNYVFVITEQTRVTSLPTEKGGVNVHACGFACVSL